MKPANFELQHSDVDQPKLHDGECATRDWPMPAGGVWVPRPAAEDSTWPDISVWGTSIVGEDEYKAEQARRNTEMRETLVRAPQPDPAEERNPVAAVFTRLMTWCQR